MKKLYIVFLTIFSLALTPLSVTPQFDEVDCCLKECS